MQLPDLLYGAERRKIAILTFVLRKGKQGSNVPSRIFVEAGNFHILMMRCAGDVHVHEQGRC